MNTRAETLTWAPEANWWLMLACVLGAGLVFNWWVALGTFVFLMVQGHRPFDFIASAMLVTAGSTFVYYEGGNMTMQLSLLSCAVVLMLMCYWIANRDQLLVLSQSALSRPILAYVLLSLANCVRGILVGSPIKNVLFELLPVLALATTFLIANGFEWKRDITLVLVALVAIAFGSASMGFYVFSVIHTHTAGVYFNAFPGVIALLLVNRALRSETIQGAFSWTLLSLPLFLHQFLSFRRGLWIGMFAGMLTSILIFTVRSGRGRWSRVGLILAILLGAGALGAISLEVFYNQKDILSQSAGRFASIGGTELTMETRSNVARLVETANVLKLIRESPWIGHGLGYTFIVPTLLEGPSRPQWWMDENYALIWLKQGLIGLGIYLWLLWEGIRFGARHARRREDPWQASWLATTAAATAFLTVFSITDWPFGQVNPVFLYSLLFGISIALARDGSIRFRWSVPAAAPTSPEEPAPAAPSV